MSPASASSPSGGSSSTARARARRARACSRPAWSSPPTCTPWASTSSRASALMFETVVRFASPSGTFLIPDDPENVDGLNFLSGKPLSFVAEQALRGTDRWPMWTAACPTCLIRMPADQRELGGLADLLLRVLPAACPATCWGSIPSTSPAWRHTRRTCSPCWASPAMRR